MSVSPPLAPIGHARLKSSVRGNASGTRAGVLLKRSSTKGTAMSLVRRSQRAPRSVPCRRHSLTKPRERLERASPAGVLELPSLINFLVAAPIDLARDGRGAAARAAPAAIGSHSLRH